MKHVLTYEECLTIKDDENFNNSVLVYVDKDNLSLRKQLNENIEKIPAPIFSEFIEAIENKSKKNIYYYCHGKGIAYPKDLNEIFEIYINMK